MELRYFISLLLVSNIAQADFIISIAGKYQNFNEDLVDSTKTIKSNTITHSKHPKTTVINSSSNTVTTYSDDPSSTLVPGLMLQSVPTEKYNLSVSIGAYLDQSFTLSLGIRL